jgi:hypothetical protein
MPRWTSPLFSDIRNALGNNVVFSTWKGRPYFRTYIIPANPRTNPQTAHREVLAKIVAHYKEVVSTDPEKGAWRAKALTMLISGFNLFVLEGRKSKLSVSPESGSKPLSVTITYTLGLAAAVAKLYQYNGTIYTDVTPAEGLSAEPDSTAEITIPAAGTYYFFIADSDILVEGDEAPQDYQAVTKWKADEVNGVAKECKVVVS